MIAPPFETVVYVSGTNPFAIDDAIRAANIAGVTWHMGSDSSDPRIWVKLRAVSIEPAREPEEQGV